MGTYVDSGESVEACAQAIVDPLAYADGRLEEACAVLRKWSPVQRVEAEGFEPFHVLTKHEDVHRVEREGDLFHAFPRYRLYRAVDEPARGKGNVRTLVRMDAPEHTAYRSLVADWFLPKNIRLMEQRVQELAVAHVDAMASRDDAYDFVREVSMQFPLNVICTMLGVPESDRAMILSMTQQAFGAEDPEYRQEAEAIGGKLTIEDLGGYVSDICSDRREQPTADITSVLANAELDGEGLPTPDLVGYFALLSTAGHDTTSSAIAGGLHALLTHPDQLDRLRQDPSLMPLAVEEIIRWTTPVKSFMRSAVADTEIRGRKILEGEAVLLMYASANFDEDVFDDPYFFDVGRRPNKHLAFGYGAHFCLGAQLARLEIRVFFTVLLERLRDIELCGDAEYIKTLFVGGVKHLPIRTNIS